MATQPVVGGDPSGLWTTYILRKFVDGLTANLFFPDYCRPAKVPKGVGGYQAKWNLPTYKIGSVTALVPGTIKSVGSGITIEVATGEIKDYGDFFQIDDLANDSQVSTALDEYKDMMAYEGAGAINKLLYNQAITATNFLHAGDDAISGVALAAGDNLTITDVAFVSKYFRGKDARGFEKLGGDFMLAIHPDAEYWLVTEAPTDGSKIAWTDVNKHVPAGYDMLVKNHRYVGRFSGTTVLRTTLVDTVTEDVSAHKNVALADWGVGWLGLGQSGPKAPTVKFKSPGPQSTNDPLDQVHTLGWKVRMAAKILDATNRCLIVYSAVASA